MDSNYISTGLLIAPLQLNIYLGCFIYLTGVIGSIGNMIVYCSRSLRDRACSVYLFWAAIVDLFYLNTVLLTRILQKGFRISITTRYDVLCKLRQFTSNYGNQLAVTFLALATLDRILLAHSSPVYRRWGNRRTLANKIIGASSLLWIMILFHRLIWYRTSNGRCEPQAGSYAYFDNLFDTIVTCVLPMVILTVLGVLLGRSIRRVVQRRLAPVATSNESTSDSQSVIHRIDAQLTTMLLMEIIVAMISFLPYAAHLIYINVTDSWSKTALRVAWETVIIEAIRLLSYLFFSSSFYVSIASFSGFRGQLLRSLRLTKQETNMVSHT